MSILVWPTLMNSAHTVLNFSIYYNILWTVGGMSHIMEQQQLHHTPPQGQQGQGQQGQVQPHQALYRPQQHQQLMGMTQVQQQQMMQQGVQYLTMTQGAEGGAANLTGPNGQQVT
jgi:hypothetical protein